MIRKITGTLESLDESAAYLALSSGLTYEVLLSAYAAARLATSIGKPVTLHTVHYLESSSQGAHFTPRLAGFTSPSDRSFFELLKSVNRVGPRKALRSMSLATQQIATAIADRDTKLLQSLPEVGKRTAETIVTTLHDKVDRFLLDIQDPDRPPHPINASDPANSSSGTDSSEPPRLTPSITREALEVLVQLGENRANALALIDQTLTADPEIADSQQLIAHALRRRTSN